MKTVSDLLNVKIQQPPPPPPPPPENDWSPWCPPHQSHWSRLQSQHYKMRAWLGYMEYTHSSILLKFNVTLCTLLYFGSSNCTSVFNTDFIFV